MDEVKDRNVTRYGILVFLCIGIAAIFVVRSLLAVHGQPPGLGDLFTLVTVAGSLVVFASGFRLLHRGDWTIAIGTGVLVGVTMLFTSLFTPYDFLGIVRGKIGQAVVRGGCTLVAALGGLVVMRKGGPVRVTLVNGDWRRLGKSLLIGLLVGTPLAVLNVFALQLTQGHPVSWQNPLAALLDALQPAIFEEMLYRFAFLGLLWLVLHRSFPGRAGWLAGLLALLVHNFMHFDDLFVQAPFMALGMGIAMSILWGLPLTILALRRDLESAVSFHWIQDTLRFLAGF